MHRINLTTVGIQASKNYLETALNLKDSVKSVRFFYSHIREGLSKNEKDRSMMRNFIRNRFYVEFDKYGMVTKEIQFSQNKDFADDVIEEGSGKNGQIDHLIPVQIDHLFRLKVTTQFRSKLTT